MLGGKIATGRIESAKTLRALRAESVAIVAFSMAATLVPIKQLLFVLIWE